MENRNFVFWKVINEFENYEVSNEGFVRNIKTGVVLKTQYTNGYKCIYLRNTEIKKKLKIHRLVAQHFIPPVEGHLHVNHIDGNKENNSNRNLEWVTPKQNSVHVVANNLQGKPKGKRITTEEKKMVVKEYYNTNITQIELAKKHNVTLRSIERWVNNSKLK